MWQDNVGAPLDSFKAEHRGQYFDVYGDWITTRYSEVFWTGQKPVDLPADFVAKYKGKTVSFTGFAVSPPLAKCRDHPLVTSPANSLSLATRGIVTTHHPPTTQDPTSALPRVTTPANSQRSSHVSVFSGGRGPQRNRR